MTSRATYAAFVEPPSGGPPAQEQQPDLRLAVHLQEFGGRIRTIRESRHGWSIRCLADRSGIGRTDLYRIESGKNLTLELVWRIATALQVHWADLLDDRMPDPPTTLHPTSGSFEHHLAAFGARVYEVRVLQHLTQHTVVDRAGINRTAMVGIEAGTQNIKLGTLLRLAAGLGVHWADLLDDREARSPRPEPGLHEALEHAAHLRDELRRLRTDLTLAQARAEVADRVAEQTAAKRITSAAARVRPIFDRHDRPRLATMTPTQLAAQLEARRTLYDYLDLICRQAKRDRLDLRPEWTSVDALRELARYLTATALDERMRR